MSAGAQNYAAAYTITNEAATEEAVLADVMTVYDALPYYSIFFWLEQDEEQLIIKHFQETCDKIRPIIARLQQLPVEDVKAKSLTSTALRISKNVFSSCKISRVDN